MDHSCSLSCELRIVKAKNIDTKSAKGGALFVRSYLSSEKGTRVIRLDTKEISSSSSSKCADHSIITWNQTFSLDCLGNKNSIKRLEQETLVFELRRTAPFVGRFRGSKLVGRGEIPWRTLLDSPEMEIEKRVVMIPKIDGRVVNYDHDGDDVKLPCVQIAMKIQESLSERKKISGCGCVDGGYNNNSCVDYEFFAIEAASEALI